VTRTGGAVADARRRRSWVEVDVGAISRNVARLARLVEPAELLAVVKAGAYGHGAPSSARAALAGGASALGVALVDEAVELRSAGVACPILLLVEPDAAGMLEAVAAGCRPTVYSTAGVEAARHAARLLDRSVGVELKVDTGMHRVGASPGDVVELARAIAQSPELRLEGLWTHLAVADDPSDPFTAEQLERFGALREKLTAAGLLGGARVHAANSAGALHHPAARLDLVRCGIACYGVPPSATPSPVALEPALAWKARVALVRDLPAGERVSYGRLYRLEVPSRLAVLPVGYADGVPRAWFESGGAVLLGGRRCPVAGAVTMDQTVVDCGAGSSVEPGDEAVLLGRQGSGVLDVAEWARRLGTIPYEVLARIGPRVARVPVGTADGDERGAAGAEGTRVEEGDDALAT